ncbi:MAG: hypothetical protein Q8876_07945, partial [Bacillota bacterium]|nr:hypothetical protein [Bacillota bacterium]
MSSNLSLIIQDAQTRNYYDYSEVVSDIQLSRQIEGYAGKLEFSVVEDLERMFYEGSKVIFKYNGNNMFFGTVFQRERSQDNEIKVTAYDNLRYLLFDTFYQFDGLTCSQIFEKICIDNNIPYSIVNNSCLSLPLKTYDNVTAYGIYQDASDQTLSA